MTNRGIIEGALNTQCIKLEEMVNINKYTTCFKKRPYFFEEYMDEDEAPRVVPEIEEPVDSTVNPLKH